MYSTYDNNTNCKPTVRSSFVVVVIAIGTKSKQRKYELNSEKDNNNNEKNKHHFHAIKSTAKYNKFEKLFFFSECLVRSFFTLVYLNKPGTIHLPAKIVRFKYFSYVKASERQQHQLYTLSSQHSFISI